MPVRKTVSHSEAEQFLRCQRAHFYGYVLELQSITPGFAMHRGTLGHQILEAFHNVLLKTPGAYNAAYNAGIRQYGILSMEDDNAMLLNDIIGPLKYYMKEWFPAQGFEVLAVEKEFVQTTDETLKMPFVMDIIVRDRFGVIWVFDGKFTYDFYSEKHLAILPQLPKYVAGLRALGYPVTQVGYLLFRTRGKKGDTMAERFKRINVPLSENRVNQTFKEQTLVSREIQRRKSLPVEVADEQAFRVFNSKTCESCQFFQLCQTELNNPDQRETVLNFYKKRERREFPEEV